MGCFLHPFWVLTGCSMFSFWGADRLIHITLLCADKMRHTPLSVTWWVAPCLSFGLVHKKITFSGVSGTNASFLYHHAHYIMLIFGRLHGCVAQSLLNNNSLLITLFIIAVGLVNSGICSHGRAPDLFIESITSQCPFRAYPCTGGWDEFTRGNCQACPSSGCPEMGYNAINSKGKASGKYYLFTNDEKPFSCGSKEIDFNVIYRLYVYIESPYMGEIKTFLFVQTCPKIKSSTTFSRYIVY